MKKISLVFVIMILPTTVVSINAKTMESAENWPTHEITFDVPM